jgi:hypothetical protein
MMILDVPFMITSNDMVLSCCSSVIEKPLEGKSELPEVADNENPTNSKMNNIFL